MCWPARKIPFPDRLLFSVKLVQKCIKLNKHISHFTNTDQGYILHLNDTLDAGDSGIEKSADSLIIIHTVCVSQAHKDDVGWKSRNEANCYTTRLQI